MTEKLAEAKTILERGIGQGAFPGSALAFGTSHGFETVCVGRFWYADDAPEVSASTLYDLASLTKVLATTEAAMALDVDPEAPAASWLPEWRENPLSPMNGGERGQGVRGRPASKELEKSRVTIRHLLEHSSGLPSFRRYEEQTLDPVEAMRLVLAEPLEAEPGTRFLYSDLSMIVLAEVLDRIRPGALRKFGEGPGLQFCPEPDQFQYCPPAEPVEPWRWQMWAFRNRDPEPKHGEYIRGEVHDPRAALLGGIAGHAGLFGTIDAVAQKAQHWLAKVLAGDRQMLEWIRPSGPDGSRGLGFELSNGMFGHTGFTGTMLWVDPAHDRFVVMLSNRIHPSAENLLIREVRPQILSLLVS